MNNAGSSERSVCAHLNLNISCRVPLIIRSIMNYKKNLKPKEVMPFYDNLQSFNKRIAEIKPLLKE